MLKLCAISPLYDLPNSNQVVLSTGCGLRLHLARRQPYRQHLSLLGARPSFIGTNNH